MIRFAQVLHDGSLAPMHFSKEKRDRIDAVAGPYTWLPVTVTADGTHDVRSSCGGEFIATVASIVCGPCRARGGG